MSDLRRRIDPSTDWTNAMTESVTRSNTTRTSQTPARPQDGKIFAILTGITSLVVLLQAVWAGVFLEHDGERDASSAWIEMHARGAELAIVLALATTVFAFVRMRPRKDLWLGSLALTMLLVLESYLGGLIKDAGKDTLTAVHVPLGMAIMALVVWIPLRARQSRAVSAA